MVDSGRDVVMEATVDISSAHEVIPARRYKGFGSTRWGFGLAWVILMVGNDIRTDG